MQQGRSHRPHAQHAQPHGHTRLPPSQGAHTHTQHVVPRRAHVCRPSQWRRRVLSGQLGGMRRRHVLRARFRPSPAAACGTHGGRMHCNACAGARAAAQRPSLARIWMVGRLERAVLGAAGHRRGTLVRRARRGEPRCAGRRQRGPWLGAAHTLVHARHARAGRSAGGSGGVGVRQLVPRHSGALAAVAVQRSW